MHRQFPALAVAVLALTATAGFSQTPPEDSKQNAKAGDSTPDPFAMDLDSLSNTQVHDGMLAKATSLDIPLR